MVASFGITELAFELLLVVLEEEVLQLLACTRVQLSQLSQLSQLVQTGSHSCETVVGSGYECFASQGGDGTECVSDESKSRDHVGVSEVSRPLSSQRSPEKDKACQERCSWTVDVPGLFSTSRTV